MSAEISPKKRILLVNGPNLNMLGIREPTLYGTATLSDVEGLARAAAHSHGFELDAIQSNHEGVLLDRIHACRATHAGIVVNPGGLAHTSVVLRDALSAVGLPVAEVHITDVARREGFRRFSYISDVAVIHVTGRGVRGYVEATAALAARIGMP